MAGDCSVVSVDAMEHRTAALLQLAAVLIVADGLDCSLACMRRSARALLPIAVHQHQLRPVAETLAAVTVVVALVCWPACTPRRPRDARAPRIAAHPLLHHPAADTLAVETAEADCSRSSARRWHRVAVAALLPRAVHQLAVAILLRLTAVAMPLRLTVVATLLP
ncbi:MAG: hypothetical protein ACK6A7_18720 [Planctomycetota bacterium]